MSERSDHEKLRRLLDFAGALASEANPRRAIERILEHARVVTDARYAALGVLDGERIELECFTAVGIDATTREAIGELPRGRGVLGVLISHPQPLRLADVRQHPRSYGLPEGHPRMGSFLGVPILIDGQAWGNLYLAEKQDGAQFTDADEQALVQLAECAAIAIRSAMI